MVDSIAVIVIVAIYLVVIMVTGIKAGLKRENSISEYVAANKSLNLFVMYFLMGGAIFSAFAFLGGPGLAFSKGAASLYFLVFGALGLLPWYVYGPRAYRLGKRYGYLTQAELISDRFQSPGLSVLLGIFSVLGFIQYIAVQLKGMGYVLEVTTGGLIPFWMGVLISYLTILLYVLFSGVRGVAWTNVVQGILMLCFAWGLGLYLPFRFHGGIAPMFQKIAEADPTFLTVGPPQMGWASYTSAILISFLAFAVWPQHFMKAYTTSSEDVLKQTIVWYPTFAIFLVPVLFIGFSAIGVVDPSALRSPDQILPTMLMQTGASPILLGLLAAAVLAAAMSTTDSVTHAAGSIYVLDIHRKVINPKMSDKQMVMLAKIGVAVTGGAAYCLATFGAQTLMRLQLGAIGSMAQLLPLVFATFFWPRATAPGAISGFIMGSLVNYYYMLVAPSPFNIEPGIWGLIANFVVLAIVSYITPPQSLEHVRRFVDNANVRVD